MNLIDLMIVTVLQILASSPRRIEGKKPFVNLSEIAFVNVIEAI